MAYTKQEFKKVMESYGDACIHFVSAVSGKSKYTVGTTDFTTKYVADKFTTLKTRNLSESDAVLIFAWDTDSFKKVDPASVTKIEPLNRLITNDFV